MSDDPKETKLVCNLEGEDTIRVGPPLPNGNHVAIRHRPDHTEELGVVRIFREGESLPDDAHLLSRREDGNWSVGESIAELKSGVTKGPAKVTTEAYRTGYDKVFGSKSN